ncbi:MAG: hypothetical protein C4551_10790 [Bacillota bacterium]|nr:MAG: hypothetical protein C4551_10790 [Bacillota bacterium]
MPQLDLSEIGLSGLSRMGGTVYEEFLPQLQGPKAIKVYREMSTNDPVVGAILFAVDMLLRQVSWRVEPASPETPDQEAAEFLQSCLGDMSATWEDTVSEILSMLVYGFSYHEIVYKRRLGDQRDPTKRSRYTDGRIGWRKLAGRSQDTLYQWEFDEHGGIQAMVQQAPPDYSLRRIPIEKGLLFRTRAHKGSPEGYSVLRNAYRPWWMKKRIEEIEAIGIERDLAGLPIAWVPPELLGPNATAEQKATLDAIKKIVRNVRRDEQEGIVFPLAYRDGEKAFDFGLLSTGGRRQFDTDSVIARYDQRIAMTVLCDFILLGHEKVGSFALAQPLGSKVLTPTGWTTMGEIKKGDEVICPLGYRSVVLDTFEHGVRDVYRISFADGRSVLASSDHKWVVTSKEWLEKGLPGKFHRPPAQALPEPSLIDGYGILTTSEIMNRMSGKRGTRKFHVPRCAPIRFGEQLPLPIDPYVLGVILGDGYIRDNAGPTFAATDEEIRREVERRLPEGHHLSDAGGNSSVPQYRISGPGSGQNQVLNGLRALGLIGARSQTKFIPPMYLTASIEDRLWLLRGLMDTDGYADGQIIFATNSEGLRDGVAYLARSLGGCASMSTKFTVGYLSPITKQWVGKPSVGYHVIIRMPEDLNPFFLTRKASRVRPSQKRLDRQTSIVSIEHIGQEEVRCIAVSSPSGMYVTDDFVPTHNSTSKTTLFSTACSAWLDSIAAVLNRHAVPRLFALNGLDTEKLPRLVPGEVDAPDLKELGEFVKSLAGTGMELFPDDKLENYLRQAAKLPLKEVEAV